MYQLGTAHMSYLIVFGSLVHMPNTEKYPAPAIRNLVDRVSIVTRQVGLKTFQSDKVHNATCLWHMFRSDMVYSVLMMRETLQWNLEGSPNTKTEMHTWHIFQHHTLHSV